jgi:hypothetical protein
VRTRLLYFLTFSTTLVPDHHCRLPPPPPPFSHTHPGDLTFNPEKDTLVGADGREVHLESPYGDELPAQVRRGHSGPVGRHGHAADMQEGMLQHACNADQMQ